MEIGPGLLSAATRWLPLLPYDDEGAPRVDGACIRALAGDPEGDLPPPSPPTLRLGTVSCWVSGNRAWMTGPSGFRGWAWLDEARADLFVPHARIGDAGGEWDLFSACTLSGALLLGRLGRALAHAAAVVAPDGGAWLLVGDSHAGKTTTCANLLQAGWRYVSDDHVLLSRAVDGGIGVEGWPRPFHLDEGWETGAPVRRRGTTDPHARWPGRWQRTAPLAGLLFPQVDAERATERAPVASADALGRLLRQSPWLLADRAAAPALLALLQQAAAFPASSLRLGLDTYADPALLVERLAIA